MHEYRKNIRDCKQRMIQLRGRRDERSMVDLGQARRRYVHLLAQQETFWKQRAKQHWLATGDANNFFIPEHLQDRKKILFTN